MRLLFVPLLAACALTAPAQLVRQANSTLTLPAAAPTTGFTGADALGGMTFSQPLTLRTPPGETTRLFIGEKTGLIRVVTDLDSASTSTSTYLNLTTNLYTTGESGLLGFAFHPQYATNGYLYVFRCYRPGGTSGPVYNRISRFTRNGANSADPASELVLIDQLDEASNHNGGNLMFGPDGYLYVGHGDEGGGGDTYSNSQRIDKDFFSGMIRIDVDRLASNLEPNPHAAVIINSSTGKANYKVPADNPWVGATSFNTLPVTPANVRTEFYAVGLRNPWRWSFDPANGRLWLADVGQDAYEEVNIIRKGGNYGWKFREGLHGYSGTPPAGVTFDDPIIEYTHSVGISITGGVVWRGSNLAQLFGKYIYADYSSGRVWALEHNQATGALISNVQLYVESGIVGFGYDPRNGDVLYCNINNGKIRRIVSSGAPSGSYPATLTATGAFSNLATLTPNAGIVSYEPNVSFWSDYAQKQRWFSIPTLGPTMTYSAEGNWTYPTGTVWVKHFEIETTRGVAATKRRLETRFIRKTADGIYGITYRWNAAGTEATLVGEEGETETFNVTEGAVTRPQTWIYPSRASCLNCHTQVGGYALSFNTAQLNKDHVFDSQTQNQISALSTAGYLSAAVTTPVATLPKFASDETQSVEWRVRSYLAVNCANCHQPGGLGQGQWDARYTTKTALAGLINGAVNNNFGDAANRVIAPGDVAHSVMYTRLNSAGGAAYHMPPLATTEKNIYAVSLLADWIAQTTTYQTFAQWQTANFGSTSAPAAQAGADPDGDGNTNRFEFLTGTNANSATSRWSLQIERSPSQVRLLFPRIANLRFLALVSTDLQTWTPWNVPSNSSGFSATSFNDIISGPFNPTGPMYFRLQIDEP